MITKKDLLDFFKIAKIGERAVKKAQAENRKKGLPNIFVKNKKIYYELPDGTITTKDPLNN